MTADTFRAAQSRAIAAGEGADPYGPCALCHGRPEVVAEPGGPVLLWHRTGLACHVTIVATSEATARERWSGYARGARA